MDGFAPEPQTKTGKGFRSFSRARKNDNHLERILFVFVLQLCNTIRVEGLQTKDGARTLSQQLWSGAAFCTNWTDAWLSDCRNTIGQTGRSD